MKKTAKLLIGTLCAAMASFSILSFGCMAAAVPDGNTFVKLGDANRNGIVNIIDLVCVKKHLANKGSVVSIAAVDFNKDGSVSADDVVALRKVLLGIISEQDWSDGIY